MKKNIFIYLILSMSAFSMEEEYVFNIYLNYKLNIVEHVTCSTTSHKYIYDDTDLQEAKSNGLSQVYKTYGHFLCDGKIIVDDSLFPVKEIIFETTPEGKFDINTLIIPHYTNIILKGNFRGKAIRYKSLEWPDFKNIEGSTFLSK